MPPFAAFLSDLTVALEAFDRRIEAAAPVVRCDSNAANGEAGEILIGLGHDVAPQSGRAVCLNNKRAASALGVPVNPASVTRLIQLAPGELVAAWGDAIGLGSSPVAVLSGACLVVEDASPDSCFGLVCLLARLAGVPVDALPSDWVAYIDAWEEGSTGPTPGRGYGTLHNALVHGWIEDHPGEAWRAGLHLLHETLTTALPPSAIPPDATGLWLSRARAALAFDAQAYEENLRHATCLQLSVPIAGLPARKRLVDACLMQETLPVGATKDYARTDRANSHLGNGFSLLAIHRPEETGTGNDITISADPLTMLDLRDLWLALETAEDARWDGTRPCDTPRADLGFYPLGRRPDDGAAPNQPWFHTRDVSLIAAPKRLADGQVGSRLSWPEVCEALWQTYQPLRDVRFHAGLRAATHPDRDAPVLLQQCRPEPPDAASPGHHGHPDTPRLLVARWDRPDNTNPAFRITPTLCRCLAHCVLRPGRQLAPIRLQDLPTEDAYEVFDLPGGVAIITDHGAFLLDGGLPRRPPLADLVDAWHGAARVLCEVRSTGRAIVRLLEETRGFLHGDNTGRANDLLGQLAYWQVRVARAAHEEHAATLSPLARRFRAALLARWGIDVWVAGISRDVEEIKQALVSHTGQEINRRLAFLQMYGLPVAVGASLFGFVFAGLSPGLDLRFGAIHWKGLALYGVLVAVGCLAMRIGARVADWRARRRLRGAKRG